MRPIIGISCGGTPASHQTPPLQAVKTDYVSAVEMAGGTAILIPTLDTTSLQTIWSHLDGLLLPGGGDISPEFYGQSRRAELDYVDPIRDRVELWLARAAVLKGLPLLAICRGIQVLNVACEGTLYQDIAAEIPTALKHRHPSPPCAPDYLAHSVRPVPGSALSVALGSNDRNSPRLEVMVNSRHHQAIDKLGADLTASARSSDGVIEAVEMPGHRFILGVQWHPEDLVSSSPSMAALFGAFLKAALEPAGEASGED